ncbi:response regulator [Spirosoma utsteinense]|uniref:CheY-like chemotaxis protein n=1 Tax=Spirosoma utsteinense TaxID=2585773 RepID=A0ABR6W9W3_9BACT|nr:response regulator [Spirosoma utsteinense]MBC3789034.1 CheY-like chemotaxis protein [Spirosoma utsteinense]MBC3792640.1 CheY-like chemotaxis protein [Spirosoma utsteinense]
MNTFRVLLSDDDEDDCYFLTAIFNDLYGDQVQISCPSSVLACQRLLVEPEPPHLIVLDFNLPPANALDLLDWMASQPHLQSVTTVLWSSRISEQEQVACLQAGVVKVIPKQSDYIAMKEVIRSVVAQWIPEAYAHRQRTDPPATALS